MSASSVPSARRARTPVAGVGAQPPASSHFPDSRHSRCPAQLLKSPKMTASHTAHAVLVRENCILRLHTRCADAREVSSRAPIRTGRRRRRRRGHDHPIADGIRSAAFQLKLFFVLSRNYSVGVSLQSLPEPTAQSPATPPALLANL